MTDIEDRVMDCFTAVFPQRSREELVAAERGALEEWDSLAGLTIMAVLSEQFQIEIDIGDLDGLGSFRSAVAYVTNRIEPKE